MRDGAPPRQAPQKVVHMSFTPHTDDLKYAMNTISGFSELVDAGTYGELGNDLVDAVLDEAGRFALEVLAPLNTVGDRHGAKLEDGVVTTAPGWKEAYRSWVDGGWGTLPCEAEFGGQGLPITHEPCGPRALEHGQFRLRHRHAPDPGRGRGAWSPTVREELQAKVPAQDVKRRVDGHHEPDRTPGGVRPCRSARQGGTAGATAPIRDFRHQDLHHPRRTRPDREHHPSGAGASAGRACGHASGISLFLVPKFLVNEDGSLGERNDVKCVGVEEKLGIHGSPTCVMAYGENGRRHGLARR